jgi:hypothetical protein
MSNKSSVSSQVISLPKGGGALQGIGEKFAPDLHTRMCTFSVPVALPPGRNGFQPELNLDYSKRSRSRVSVSLPSRIDDRAGRVNQTRDWP